MYEQIFQVDEAEQQSANIFKTFWTDIWEKTHKTGQKTMRSEVVSLSNRTTLSAGQCKGQGKYDRNSF